MELTSVRGYLGRAEGVSKPFCTVSSAETPSKSCTWRSGSLGNSRVQSCKHKDRVFVWISSLKTPLCQELEVRPLTAELFNWVSSPSPVVL